MIVYFEKLSEISTDKVSFYSPRFIKSSLTEYEKFLQNDFSKHSIELSILTKTIKEMGLRGAKPYYFTKDEKGAFALPIVSPEVKKANKKDFGIRLYCLFLNESIVVLLNGGIKTVAHSPEKCPNISQFFKDAIKLESKLSKAKQNGDVFYYSGEICFDPGFDIDL